MPVIEQDSGAVGDDLRVRVEAGQPEAHQDWHKGRAAGEADGLSGLFDGE